MVNADPSAFARRLSVTPHRALGCRASARGRLPERPGQGANGSIRATLLLLSFLSLSLLLLLLLQRLPFPRALRARWQFDLDSRSLSQCEGSSREVMMLAVEFADFGFGTVVGAVVAGSIAISSISGDGTTKRGAAS